MSLHKFPSRVRDFCLPPLMLSDTNLDPNSAMDFEHLLPNNQQMITALKQWSVRSDDGTLAILGRAIDLNGKWYSVACLGQVTVRAGANFPNFMSDSGFVNDESRRDFFSGVGDKKRTGQIDLDTFLVYKRHPGDPSETVVYNVYAISIAPLFKSIRPGYTFPKLTLTALFTPVWARPNEKSASFQYNSLGTNAKMSRASLHHGLWPFMLPL